jgi:hypothetical protein
LSDKAGEGLHTSQNINSRGKVETYGDNGKGRQ